MNNASESPKFLHVEDKWDEAVAARLDGLGPPRVSLESAG